MNRRKLLLGIGTASATTLTAGCTSDDDKTNNDGDSADTQSTPTPTATSTATPTEAQSNVEILKDRYPNWAFIDGDTYLVVLKPIEANADSYSVTISGTIVNGSDTDYDYAQITFGLYTGPNASGAKVGNAIDNISGLESGQKWRFEAIGTSDEASSFEIEDTTAY